MLIGTLPIMPSTTKRQFAALLECRLAPDLRSDGFVMDDSQWSRIRRPVINCIQVQSRRDDLACCANLGVHLTFLPKVWESQCSDSNHFVLQDCEIQTRLAWEGETDHWWIYDEAENAVTDLVACYHEQGKPFFARFQKFPYPFVDISLDDIRSGELVEKLGVGMTKIRAVLLLARVHDYLGNADMVTQLSRMGQQIAGRAVGPKVAFRELLHKYS